jgi:hypothetical protein
MNLSSGVVCLSVLLICLGCAPISEVMRADLKASQYTDVIERGESWLKDASLERQATAEGREIHRLVAEAHLKFAIARGRLSDFEAFRKRYAKFSAYEDLLTLAYEESAKVALVRKVGTNPSWASFEWFEARFGQSQAVKQARARIMTAELGRLNVNPTLEGYKALRERFVDWDEFKSHREGLLKAEAQHYAKTRLGADATLEAHRTYALTYPNLMTPELIAELTRLELAHSAELDDLEAWQALEARYSNDWALPLKLEARSGVLAMKIRSAVHANTQHAFDVLNADYAKSTPRLISEIAQAQCGWILSEIRGLTEMRQTTRRDKALRLLALMDTEASCGTLVTQTVSNLNAAAMEGDIWVNRILRRLNELEPTTSPAPLDEQQEATIVWASTQGTDRTDNLKDVLDWYADSEFALSADQRLVALLRSERKGRDRIQVEMGAYQTGRRRRSTSLVTLNDRFHGPVAVHANNLELVSTQSGGVVKLVSVKPVGKSHIWFTGQVTTLERQSAFRSELMKFKRYYSLYDTDLTTGVITQRGRRLRWKKVKQTDRLLETLSSGQSRLLLNAIPKLSKELRRRAIATRVFHIADSEYTGIGGSTCAEMTKVERVKCEAAALPSLNLSSLAMANQHMGLRMKSQEGLRNWLDAFKQMSISVESLDGFERLGAKSARSSKVKLSSARGMDAQAVQLGWQPEYVWHWATAEESPSAEPKQVGKVNVDERQSAKVPWSTDEDSKIQRFSNPLGDIAIVSGQDGGTRQLYTRAQSGEWSTPAVVPMDSEHEILYASLVQFTGRDTVRILTSNQEILDWLVATQKWLKTTKFVRLKSDTREDAKMASSTALSKTLGLNHRTSVVLSTDVNDGVWRSVDAGKRWLHSHAGRRFDQLKQYHQDSSMLCARITVPTSNLKGVECSQDDGLTWQRYLSTVKPVSLTEKNGELVVEHEGLNLRLGRLIDEGRVRGELLFVGKSRRLSQTGDWFGQRLRSRIRMANDRLLVSRALKAGQSASEDAQEEPFGLPLSMVRVSADLFSQPNQAPDAASMWTYAIIGHIAHTEPRP